MWWGFNIYFFLGGGVFNYIYIFFVVKKIFWVGPLLKNWCHTVTLKALSNKLSHGTNSKMVIKKPKTKKTLFSFVTQYASWLRQPIYVRFQFLHSLSFRCLEIFMRLQYNHRFASRWWDLSIWCCIIRKGYILAASIYVCDTFVGCHSHHILPIRCLNLYSLSL